MITKNQVRIKIDGDELMFEKNVDYIGICSLECYELDEY